MEHGLIKKWISNKKKLLVVVAVGFVLSIGTISYLSAGESSSKEESLPYTIATIKDGTIASSTLLSGTVKALSEQYVYYDASRGKSAVPTVAVGNYVYVGQQLVQYSTTDAQAAYDEAIRNLNKAGREINHLTTYGVPQADTMDSLSGEQTGTSQLNADYNTQLQNLYDAYATAEAQVTKAQAVLNDTVILSNVDGTVVAVENNIDTGSKESQVLVHVTSEGQLQVEGNLTEYDLANIREGQAVKIKSKVYPDKVWEGIITSISNYPSKETSNTSGSNNLGASYPYKAKINGDLGELKQGFSVSVEVVNDSKGTLVPTSAVIQEGEKSFVWTFDKKTKKVNKVQVMVGSADALNQEIKSGLKANHVVIVTPDDQLKEGLVIEETIEMLQEGEGSGE